MAIVHVPSLLILFLSIFPIITNSSPQSEALLKLKASFNNTTSLDSWKPEIEPCGPGKDQWTGVACENGVVSGLRLGKMGLSGKIDVDALASLSSLRSVAFMFNNFSGPIPIFHASTALSGLYLAGNQFSGEIPADYFSKLGGLKNIWLSSNNFSGPIPPSLTQLTQLSELHLENNRFSGLIPSIECQSLFTINLSNNDLEGEVPASLSRFSNNAFKGNAGLCAGNSPCDPSKIRRQKNRNSDDLLVVIFLFIMGCSSLVMVLLAAVFLFRQRRRGAEATIDDEPVKQGLETPLTSGVSGRKLVGSSKRGFGSSIYGGRGRGDGLVFLNEEKGSFGMGDMMTAASQGMGNGALGSSFKATLASGMTVVVKTVKESDKMGRDEFDEKMKWLGSLRHKNVLPPLAYYNKKDERLILYEYQHKGSLRLLLHDNQGSSLAELNWPLRLKIIQGIARGLDFLHTELSSLELPHGNLKSSNVLLSEDYEPLLADYGFWSFISQSQAARSLMAFKAPEAGSISPKCDVYFLGIMILEIIARKFPSQYLSNAQGGTDLVQWARSLVAEGREAELLDPNVANTTDFVQQMKQLVHIASSCTEDDPNNRLGLTEVVRWIKNVCVNGSCGHEIKALDVLPSLREGFTDAQSMAALQYTAAGSSNGGSGKKRDSNGDLSGCKSFSFDIS